MFRLLLRKEWLLVRRDQALWLTLICYLALLGWGTYNSVRQTRATQEHISAAQRDEAERWQRIEISLQKLRENAGDKPLFSDVRSPSFVGGFDGPRYAVLPVSELAALSAGEALPQQALVTTFSRYESGREEIDNPVNSVAGNFDLLFVVLFVLPLALIALTYNMISAEREAGTWALLLSFGVAPRDFARMKCLWRGALLLLPTWGAGGLACAATNGLTNGRLLAPSVLARFAIWMCGVGAYTALWLALAALVNARSLPSARNILTLVTLWVCLTMLTPGLTHLMAMKLHPPRNRFELALLTREMNVEREQKLAAMYEWYYAQHPQDRPAPDLIAAANKPIPGGARSSDSRRTYIPAVYLDEQLRPLLEQRREQRRLRQRIIQWGSLFSPALTLQLLTDDLAGTDTERFEQFEQSINAAQKQWRDFFGPHIMRLKKLSVEDYAALPYFDKQREKSSEFNFHSVWLLLLLIASMVLASVAAHQRMRE